MSDGFLSRWSRRKRGVEAEDTPVEAPPPVAAEAAPPPAPEPEFDLSRLPPLDSLTAESDFSVFLRPGVPAAIRGAALRKAWVADPLIRDYVSSLDYGWDFNAPASMPGFSLELGETGERLRKLVAQAVGERDEEEEGAPPVSVALVEEPPAPLVAEAPMAELSAPEPPPAASEGDEPPPAASEGDEPPPPPRRHGGAMPA